MPFGGSDTFVLPFLSHPHIRSMWGMRYCASFTIEKCTRLPLPVAIATITMEMHGREIWGFMTATQGWGKMEW